MKTIEKLKTQDFEILNKLLLTVDLPIVDTNDQTDHFFKVSDSNGEISGAIGLEIYGKYGLLRSLVVAERYRNKGIAKMLVEKILSHSKGLKLQSLVLLTTTADQYFTKLNFEKVNRNDVPEEIKQSKEFSSICPVSAIVMQKNL